jgi:hypothetical protein
MKNTTFVEENLQIVSNLPENEEFTNLGQYEYNQKTNEIIFFMTGQNDYTLSLIENEKAKRALLLAKLAEQEKEELVKKGCIKKVIVKVPNGYATRYIPVEKAA